MAVTAVSVQPRFALSLHAGLGARAGGAQRLQCKSQRWVIATRCSSLIKRYQKITNHIFKVQHRSNAKLYLSLLWIMDARYTTVQWLLESDKIRDFQSIFLHIPVSVVAKDCGVSEKKLKRWITHPEKIQLGLIFTLSTLLQHDAFALSELAKKNMTCLPLRENLNKPE